MPLLASPSAPSPQSPLHRERPRATMPIAVRDLLADLIAISEKSAHISRLCRTKSNGLFDLLIQEKTNEAKNPRFIQDFKTFADVLIQEVAKHTLELKFPGLSKRVYGEESNQFENRLGESITVQLGRNESQTRDMLTRILDGDEQTARSLVSIIYETDTSFQSPVENVAVDLELDLDDIGVWIDPIDSTSEYINGQWCELPDDHTTAITPHGLQCVTCLFGVFHMTTGLPLMGVIHQPFYRMLNNSESSRCYSGRHFWGLSINGVCQNNLNELSNIGSCPASPKPILIGNKEGDAIVTKLSAISSTLYVAGAGYKLLCVILNKANMLVTSSTTTFYWDTCAGHAILRSLGGGIIALRDIMTLGPEANLTDCDRLQVRYRPKRDQHHGCDGYNHSNGLVAYRSQSQIQAMIPILNS